MTLSKGEIEQQSLSAYKQWGEQWKAHSIAHSQYKMKSLKELQNSGVGKALLLVANGFSFEENLETIKKYRNNIDIMACDKTIGHLIENGIKPEYCMVCDANVNYEKYLEPYKDELYKTTLFMNVCGNPEWTKNGNWKKKYFFVNEDVIQSEKEYQKLSGCSNLIPAATNVSGAMVVLATQSTRQGRNNWFGYDKIVLIGFDYSWRFDGKYYAFDNEASGKQYYMRHINVVDRGGDYCFTSHNLHFSSRWLSDYIKNFDLPIVSGSSHTLVQYIKCNDLEHELQYKYKVEDGDIVRKKIAELNMHRLKAREIESTLVNIGRDHWLNFKQSI